MNNTPNFEKIKEVSFNEELEKIALFGFKQNKNKRKRKKQETWKSKFASDLKMKVQEYNIGERMAVGFARMMSRHGI